MPAQTGLLSNPLMALLPPDQQQNLMQLQQQQAIGNALTQQGLAPIDTSNRQVGGIAYHVSPLEGASKLLNAYLGNKLSMNAMGQQAQLTSSLYGNAFGSSPQQQAPAAAPADPSQQTDAGGMTGGQSGPGVVSAPVPTPGAAAPTPSPQQVGAALTGAPGPQASAGGALSLPGKTPQQSMQIFSIVGPEAYAKMLTEWAGPTAATKAAQQGGFDPQAANRAQFGKDSFIAPVQIGPNQVVQNPMTGQTMSTPAAAPAGYQNIQGADGKFYTVPVAGGTQAVQGSAAAEAGGNAQYKLTQVYDPISKQMVYSTDANIAGGSPGGSGGRGIPPIPTIPTPPGMNAPAGSGQPPPLPPGMGGSGGAPNGSPAPSGGFAAAPPVGMPANADAAQAAAAQTMKDSYQKLQAGRSTSQAALDALQTMQTLGAQKSAGAIGPIGTGLASAGLSSNAVEYEKQRANVISLLAGQSAGQDGAVSDAARANVGNSVPDYGKPKDAIASGVQTLINQTRAQQLKADVLTPAYNSGDSKTYTTLENQFDQTIKPSMMPAVSSLLAMPPGPARAAALSTAVKDPNMHSALDLLVRTGTLK